MSTVNRELVFQRIYHAQAELVYFMWTDPMQLSQWYGPDGYTLTTEKMDLHPGGSWSYTLQGTNGKNYSNQVLFLELERPGKIVYRYIEDGSSVATPFVMQLFFEPEGATTRLTMQLAFDTPEDLEWMARGYEVIGGCRQILQRLAKYLDIIQPEEKKFAQPKGSLIFATEGLPNTPAM